MKKIPWIPDWNSGYVFRWIQLLSGPVTVCTIVGTSLFSGKEFLLHLKASAAKAVLTVDSDVIRNGNVHDLTISFGKTSKPSEVIRIRLSEFRFGT